MTVINVMMMAERVEYAFMSLLHESSMLHLLSFMLSGRALLPHHDLKNFQEHFHPGAVKMCHVQAERGVSSRLQMGVMP